MRSLALASLLALASIKLGKSAGLTKAEQAIFAREHARAHAENNASIVSGARMFFDVRIFGQNPIMLPVSTDAQESFEDPGATCVDENGHQDTNMLQQTGDKVVLSKPGVYSIMYRCPDTIWQERIVVVSKRGCKNINVTMGDFSISTYVLQAKTYKGRPVYSHGDGSNVLFYEGNDQFGMWSTGPSVGKSQGMRVTDPALTPDDVTETWEMWTGSRDIWQSMPQIKAKCADKIPEKYCETIGKKLCGKWMLGGHFYHKQSCLQCLTQQAPEMKSGGCSMPPKVLCTGIMKGMTPLPAKQAGKLCKLSAWADWSPCTATCGVASKTRKRMVVKKGAVCPPTEQVSPCNNDPCPWVPGHTCVEKTDYGQWSDCSHICGQPAGGYKLRYRVDTKCLAVNQYRPLTMKLIQKHSCDVKSMPKCKDGSAYQEITPSPPAITKDKASLAMEKTGQTISQTPTIKIVGSNPIMVKKNRLNMFQDPGAICWKPYSTNKQKYSVKATGKVDSSTVGNYKITYSCKGAKSLTRTVRVTELGCEFMEVAMGIFKAGTYHFTGKVHDGRPVYAELPQNNSLLYYHGNQKWGEWAISHSLGDKQKLLKVEDPAIVPDDIVGRWHMWNKGKSLWNALPNMKITCVAPGDRDYPFGTR